MLRNLFKLTKSPCTPESFQKYCVHQISSVPNLSNHGLKSDFISEEIVNVSNKENDRNLVKRHLDYQVKHVQSFTNLGYTDKYQKARSYLKCSVIFPPVVKQNYYNKNQAINVNLEVDKPQIPNKESMLLDKKDTVKSEKEDFIVKIKDMINILEKNPKLKEEIYEIIEKNPRVRKDIFNVLNKNQNLKKDIFKLIRKYPHLQKDIWEIFDNYTSIKDKPRLLSSRIDPGINFNNIFNNDKINISIFERNLNSYFNKSNKIKWLSTSELYQNEIKNPQTSVILSMSPIHSNLTESRKNNFKDIFEIFENKSLNKIPQKQTLIDNRSNKKSYYKENYLGTIRKKLYPHIGEQTNTRNFLSQEYGSIFSPSSEVLNVAARIKFIEEKFKNDREISSSSNNYESKHFNNTGYNSQNSSNSFTTSNLFPVNQDSQNKILSRNYHVLMKQQNKKLKKYAQNLKQYKGNVTAVDNIKKIRYRTDHLYKYNKLHNVQLIFKRFYTTDYIAHPLIQTGNTNKHLWKIKHPLIFKKTTMHLNEKMSSSSGNVDCVNETKDATKKEPKKRLYISDLMNPESWGLYKKNESFITKSKERKKIDEDEISQESVDVEDEKIDKKEIWNKIVKYFKARPGVPSAETFKKQILREKAEKYAKLAGMVVFDKDKVPEELSNDGKQYLYVCKNKEKQLLDKKKSIKTPIKRFYSTCNHPLIFEDIQKEFNIKRIFNKQLLFLIPKDILEKTIDTIIKNRKRYFDPDSASISSKTSTDSSDSVEDTDEKKDESKESSVKYNISNKLKNLSSNFISKRYYSTSVDLNEINNTLKDKEKRKTAEQIVKLVIKACLGKSGLVKESDSVRIVEEFKNAKIIPKKVSLPEILFKDSVTVSDGLFRATCLATFLEIFGKTRILSEIDYEVLEKEKTEEIIQELNKILNNLKKK